MAGSADERSGRHPALARRRGPPSRQARCRCGPGHPGRRPRHARPGPSPTLRRRQRGRRRCQGATRNPASATNARARRTQLWTARPAGTNRTEAGRRLGWARREPAPDQPPGRQVKNAGRPGIPKLIHRVDGSGSVHLHRASARRAGGLGRLVCPRRGLRGELTPSLRPDLRFESSRCRDDEGLLRLPRCVSGLSWLRSLCRLQAIS